MILFPATTAFTLPSRVGTAGRMRNTPVLGPVSVAVKVSVSPVSCDFRMIVLVSGTEGSRLHAPAATWIHNGAPREVACIVLLNVLSKKYEMAGGGPLTVTSTSLETTEVSAPLLKNTVAVLRIMPSAFAATVTLKLTFTLAPAVNVSKTNATASTVARLAGAVLR